MANEFDFPGEVGPVNLGPISLNLNTSNPLHAARVPPGGPIPTVVVPDQPPNLNELFNQPSGLHQNQFIPSCSGSTTTTSDPFNLLPIIQQAQEKQSSH